MKSRFPPEHPAVQQLADEIEECWNRIRSTYLGRAYTAGSRHRPSFVKSAILLLTNKITDVEGFVRAQVRSQADATRTQPSLLGTDNAIARFEESAEKNDEVDKGFYIGQVTFVNNLHGSGFSWQEIIDGAFRLSPLTSWVVCTLNGLDPEPYRVSATLELRKCPQAVEIFGKMVEALDVE